MNQPMSDERLKKLWEISLGPPEQWSTLSAGSTFKPLDAAALGETPLAGQTLSALSTLGGTATGTLSGQGTLAGPAPGPGAAFTGASGGYQLVEELGRGGMGVVYRARQRSLQREVAIKTLLPGSGAAPDKFVAEALVTGVLDHPNIVPVHELGQGPGGEVFLAMKLVGGTAWDKLLHPETPEQQLKARGLSRSDHLNTLLAVCNAIAFAHTRGVLHRDLKPENIMVGEYGEVLVMDWGIAVDIRDAPAGDTRAPHKSTIRGPAGTPSYMAPEMAEGQGDRLGPWTDVYLLGAILHELLTGRPPHTGSSLMAVLLAAARSEPPQLPADVPAPLAEICRKAMAREPADRYQTIGAFQSALEDYLTHRESLLISDKAEAELAALDGVAVADGDASRNEIYSRYAKVVARFEQALELWDGNAPARSGGDRARLAYARAALAAGDFGLAEAQVSAPATTGHRAAGELLAEIQSAAAARLRSQRTARLLRAGVVLLLLVIAGGLGSGLYLIREEQKKTASERDKALKAEGEAKAAEALAREQRDKAKAAEETARTERDKARAAEVKAQHEAWAARLQVAAGFDRRATVQLGEGDGYGALACLLRAVEVAPKNRIPEGFPTSLAEPGWARQSWRRFLVLYGSLPKAVKTLSLTRTAGMSLSDDGRYGAINNRAEGKVEIWNLETDTIVADLRSLPQPVSRVAISPDGERVAVASGKDIRIVEVKSGAITQTLSGHEATIDQLCYGRQELLVSSNKARLIAWDLRRKTRLRQVDKPTRISNIRRDLPGMISGRRFVLENYSRYAIWDPRTRSEPESLRTRDPRRGGQPAGAKLLLPARVGSILAQADDGRFTSSIVRPYQPRNAPLTLYRQPSHADGLSRHIELGRGGRLTGLVLDDAGRRVLTFAGKEVAAFDLETGERLLEIKDVGSPVMDVAVDAAGRRGAVVTGAVAYKKGRSYGPVEAVLSDGKIRVYDLDTGAPIAELGSGPRFVRRVWLSPDGRHLVTSSGELWDIDGERLIKTFRSTWKTDQADAESFGLVGEHAYRFLPDGKTLIRVAGNGPTVSVYSFPELKLKREVELQSLKEEERLASRTGGDTGWGSGLTFARVDISHDGRQILLTERLRAEEDGLIYGLGLYDAESGKRIGIRRLPRSGRSARNLVFAPNKLILDGDGHSVRVFDAAGQDPIVSVGDLFGGQNGGAPPFAVSKDGERLIVADSDLKIHRLIPEGLSAEPPAVTDAPGDAAFEAFKPFYKRFRTGVIRSGPEAGVIEWLPE